MRYLLLLALTSCGGANQESVAVAPTASAPVSTVTASAPDPKPSAPPPSATTPTSKGPTSIPGTSIRFEGGDGSSPDKAIVILGASGERDGVAAEYKYLETVYGPRGRAWHMNQQSLQSHKGKNLDALDIEHADGKSQTVYFDISDYFGKF